MTTNGDTAAADKRRFDGIASNGRNINGVSKSTNIQRRKKADSGESGASSGSSLRVELFSEAKAQWGVQHRQMFCQHDQETVVLFRACCEHLGPHATETNSFRGSPCYEKDRTRMMWFDTSFLVSMRKSAWGTNRAREVVLAIWVRRSFVEDCLKVAVCSNTFGPTPPACSNGASAALNDTNDATGVNPSAPANSSGSPAQAEPLTFRSTGAANGDSTKDMPKRNSGSVASLLSELSLASPPNLLSKRNAFAPSAEDFFASETAGGQQAVDKAVNGGDVHGGQAEPGEETGQEDGFARSRAFTSDPSTRAFFGSPVSQGKGGGGMGGIGIGSGAGIGEGGMEDRARSQSMTAASSGRMTDGVRLHWEPERLPSGEKHRTRRAVQIGLKGKWLQTLGSGSAVVKIERLDCFLAEERASLTSASPHLLKVPVARPLDVGHLEDSQLAALHLVSERTRPKLRILCLHGYLQNSQMFSQRTRQLCKKLRPTAELVYVDAPHLLGVEELPPPLPSASTSPRRAASIAAEALAATAAARVMISGEGGAPGGTGADATGMEDRDRENPSSLQGIQPQRQSKKDASQQDRSGARTWWRCDAEERKRAKAVKGMRGRCDFKGLEESLAFLRRVWDEQGPFDGLLGFSQGAAMASIFNHCAFSSAKRPGKPRGTGGGDGDGESSGGSDPSAFAMPLLPAPRFAVFISGCYQPHPTQIPSYPLGQEEAQEELPSLHVWAIEDRFVPASQSQRLAGMYLRSSVFMHRGSHYVPQTKDVVPKFVRFLDGFR